MFPEHHDCLSDVKPYFQNCSEFINLRNCSASFYNIESSSKESTFGEERLVFVVMKIDVIKNCNKISNNIHNSVSMSNDSISDD